MPKTTLDTIYQNVILLFDQAKVNFQSWEHDPILDFEADARIAKELGWTAEPTKSLFIKLKDGRHVIFLTHRDQRMDSKQVKDLLDSRPSVCSNDVMKEKTGCIPGAVCPFGHADEITLLIDPQLVNCDEIMFTPGYPEITFAFAGGDLPVLAKHILATVYWL